MNGPERLSIAELLVGRIPLPYVGGCALLALIFSIPGDVLAIYLSTWNVDLALSRVPDADAWFIVGRLALDFLLIFAVFWAVRDMRRQVVRAKQTLVPILPEGEAVYYRVFRRVSDYRPPMILAAVMIASILAFQGTRASYFTEHFVVNAFEFALLLVVFPVLGAFVWIYLSANYGIFEIGRGQLRLKPFFEDRILGLRPLGSLSLSLARPYFLLVTIAALWISFTTPADREPPQIFVLAAGLLGLGVVMFFLPLYRVHQVLLRERGKWLRATQTSLFQFVAGHQNPNTEAAKETIQELSGQFIEMKGALALQIAERKIEGLSTWPFDTYILSRFATSALTVVAILASRVALTYLGL